ncbi:MAG: response regulator transcription factor [Pseudomonadota bacterium]
MFPEPLKLIVIDDQMLVRQGICGLLSLSDRVTVVAEGSDGTDVLGLAQQWHPDVILTDMRMPKMSGIDAITTLRDAGLNTPVIILTTFDDHEQVLAGIRAGAQGYLLKDVSLDDLIAAIESVAAGETMIQPAITQTLLSSLGGDKTQQRVAELPEPLTPRETEVARLMAGGYSNKEISSALSKSEGTIKNHVSSILAKLGVRDRTRAVLKAIELGLL